MKKNRLYQMMLANRAAPRLFKAEAAPNDGEATIYIYDIIGEDYWGGGVTAKRFLDALAELGDVDTVHLRINSPGGDVFEARTIISAMQASRARFVAHIDGLAASAASFIAAAADEVEMTKGAFLMVHNAWTFAVGNRHDLADVAAMLAKVDASIADDYVAKTGADMETVQGWMDAETWFTAQEALDAKLADRIAEKAEPAKNTWNLSALANVPEALAAPAAPAEPDPEPQPEEISDSAADAAIRARRLRLAELSPV